MTNLSDFISAYDTLDIQAAADRIGVYATDFETYSEVYIFDDECFVGKSGSQYHVLLGLCDTLHDTLDAAATRLFFEHYVFECVEPTEWTTAYLTELLIDYSKFYGLTHASADEMLHEVLSTEPQDRTYQQILHIGWLEGFIDLWNMTQETEDNAARFSA